MSNDGLADAFRLWSRRTEALQFLERDEAALKFKGQMGSRSILRCRANIMEKAT